MYLELYLISEREIKTIEITSYNNSIICDVELIEENRYKITSNIEQAIEMTKKEKFEIQVYEYASE